jgi:hypothetical protein
MNKVAWLVAAALIGSGVVAATPSSAQVKLDVGPEGPSVRIGPDADRRHERRRIIERDDHLTTGSVGRCRTVVIREEDEDGDIITRRVRRCR